MFQRIWRQLGRVTLGSCAALLLAAGTARADDAAKDKEIQELKAKQEEMAKQLEYLQRMIQNQRINTGATANTAEAEVKSIVNEMLKEKEQAAKAEDEQKKKEAAEKGYEVGSDLSMSASWNNGVWIRTKNNDFSIHIGTWDQAAAVFFKEPNNLRGAAPGGALGVPGTTGIGIFDDGDYFRRARLLMEGTAYETIEWKANFCFENINSVVFDEVWVGINQLPVLGTVRFGHIKLPQGLESFSSTRFIPMIERSGLLDTFWTEFATGILVANRTENQRLFWQMSLTKNEIEFNQDGAEFGDGTYAVTGRVAALPIYEYDGRCLLHLGASFKYQTGELDRTSNLPGTPIAGLPLFHPGIDTTDVVRFRTRPDLRDSVTVPVAGGNMTFGDNNRLIDTGNIMTPYVMTTGTELLWYWNRLNVQAEATWAHMDHAFYPAVAPTAAAPLSNGLAVPGNFLRTPFQHVGSLDFWGCYAQAGFFILSGKRGYDRFLGRYDRVIPDENFFFVRGEDGSPHAGTGALEVLFRYTYIDLNDKIVRGGQLSEQTIGLNWYLNPNMKLQANYFWAERDVIAPPGFVKPNNGTLRGLGFQAAWDF